MNQPRRQWLAYGDGSYERVDPLGNLNRKKRGRDDWWVVEQDEEWEPPLGKQRPMNPKASKATSFMPGEWDWMNQDKARSDDQKEQESPALNPFSRDRKQDRPGVGKGLFSSVGQEPSHKKTGRRETGPFAGALQTGPIRSAHAAAKTGKDGRTEVRLLDRGLDPKVEVKTARRGEDKADQEPVPPWKAIAWLDQAKKRDKERAQADKPTVRNPNQTARDMEELAEPKERNPYQAVRDMKEVANRPDSSAKQARDMEGLDKSVRKVPRQAPDGVLGTPEYYRWRAEEFKQRHPDKEPPDYLLDYGHKYAKIFQDEIRPALSDEGKKWVDRTMRGLQERMEQAYQDGTLDEMDHKAFKDFATDIHSDVYHKAGFADMSMDDKIKVISALAKKGALWEVNTWLEAIELGNKIYKERVGPIPYWE